MKKIAGIVFIISIFIIFTSCNRNMGRVSAESINGIWELRQDQSGMMPTKEHGIGNGNLWKFKGNNYEQYQNGTLVKSGTFEVIKDDAVKAAVGLELPTGQFNYRIIFDNDEAGDKLFFQLEDKKLTLLSGYFPTDGGSRRIYEKVESLN